MEEKIKELQCHLEKVATDFYHESGTRILDITIRITPYETTHKIVLEYNGGHDHKVETMPGGCCHD